MSQDLELVATAFRQVHTELDRVPVEAVRDSAAIYLAKLRNTLADLYEERNSQFDRADFEQACRAA